MTQRKFKFDIKKAIAACTAAGLFVCGGMVYADELTAGLAADTNIEAVQGLSSADCAGAAINAGYKLINGHKMIPVRFVAEELGYEVSWTDEEQKVALSGANEITMYIGRDEYTIDGAAKQLGVAPVLVDDSFTYVPVELVENSIGAKIFDVDDEILTVAVPTQVSVNSISTDENGFTSVSVTDSVRGEVILYIGEDTKIAVGDKEGSAEDIKSLESGQAINVCYGAAMTMSLPPQTTALSIEIAAGATDDAEVPETVEFEGVITEVGEDYIVINENEAERQLTIPADMKMSGVKDKRIYMFDDLTVGSMVKGTRSSIETRSLPPISLAVSLQIVSLAE